MAAVRLLRNYPICVSAHNNGTGNDNDGRFRVIFPRLCSLAQKKKNAEMPSSVYFSILFHLMQMNAGNAAGMRMVKIATDLGIDNLFN